VPAIWIEPVGLVGVVGGVGVRPPHPMVTSIVMNHKRKKRLGMSVRVARTDPRFQIAFA
jgi:hypothetical protein